MDTLLERLSPPQIVAVISVACGCVVALSMIYAITKYQFQVLADETSLRREKQQAELALRQTLAERGTAGGPSLDTLLRPEGSGDAGEDAERLNAELGKRFGALQADGEQIEAAFRLAMATDPVRKATILEVMDELGGSYPAEAVLAAVRPLCGAPAASKSVPTSC